MTQAFLTPVTETDLRNLHYFMYAIYYYLKIIFMVKQQS